MNRAVFHRSFLSVFEVKEAFLIIEEGNYLIMDQDGHSLLEGYLGKACILPKLMV